MQEKDFDSLFQEITENIEFEEPSIDILEFNRCLVHISEVKLLLDKLMADILVNPDLLFQADEDFAILLRELAGVSDELSDMLVTCSCPACQGCECGEDEICEICKEEED